MIVKDTNQTIKQTSVRELHEYDLWYDWAGDFINSEMISHEQAKLRNAADARDEEPFKLFHSPCCPTCRKPATLEDINRAMNATEKKWYSLLTEENRVWKDYQTLGKQIEELQAEQHELANHLINHVYPQHLPNANINVWRFVRGYKTKYKALDDFHGRAHRLLARIRQAVEEWEKAYGAYEAMSKQQSNTFDKWKTLNELYLKVSENLSLEEA